MNQAPITANATYCATVVDQLVADGLTDAFIAPGSRSTPLALALVAHPGITSHLFHDERAAAFAAIGHGLATSRPAIVVCTSGTAGAHFYGAVIEADASAVPLIVCTADRPPELWGRGAPQTIDQTELYGTRVREFVEPGPPDDVPQGQWRSIARRLWTSAVGHGPNSAPGPVHANLSFRDPLTGVPGPLPGSVAALSSLAAQSASARQSPPTELVHEVSRRIAGRRGVLIVGRNESEPADVLALANVLGWPIIADHRSGCRSGSDGALRYFDALLRHAPFGDAMRPDVILRIGEIVASKATSQWLSRSAAAGTEVIASRPHGRHIDPEDVATLQFDEIGFITALLDALRAANGVDSAWRETWLAVDASLWPIVGDCVAGGAQPNEIAVAQMAVEAVPPGGALVVSSSMPIRDVEWYGPLRTDLAVFANRGANGIDGVIATAVGVALTGLPTICLIGDVALLHDASALIALAHRPVDLTIVVINNDGGGIFSFLPQRELLEAASYEKLFGTPHGTDLVGLAQAHGIACEPIPIGIEPGEAAATMTPDGIRMVLAITDRADNLALHDQINAAVAAAL